MFKCPRCIKEFDSYNLLARHTAKTYNLKGEQLYREYNGITEIVTCKCGCNTPTKWRIDTGYNQYVAGHNSKGENNVMFGKTHSKKARQNISKKRKEKFANGEYTFVNSVDWSETQKKVWQQEGYKEKMKKAREVKGWRQKLSKAKSGKNNPWYNKKRPEHSKLMKSPEMLSKIFAKRSMTDIEQKIVEILNVLNLEYHSQFFITHEGDTFAYDFKLKGMPILIEVDGDYWHGGPGAQQHVPFIAEVKENDTIKEKIAQHYGYTMLRFWGSDIKKRPFLIVQELLNHIKTPH